MPDWNNIVRQRLGALRLCSREFAEEVVEELAGHLEDSYRAKVQGGMMNEAALAHAVHEMESCCRKRFALRLLKEDQMSGFTRKVGLPGMLTFAVATAIQWALNAVHVQPKTILLSNGLFLSLPIAWLCLLPFCGAMGSLISRRKGGSHGDGMMAAAFPAGIMAIVLLLIALVGWIISLFVKDSGWNVAIVVPGVALGLVTYVLLTAIPLVLGAAVCERTCKTPASVA
jgi:hypothetical protein